MTRGTAFQAVATRLEARHRWLLLIPVATLALSAVVAGDGVVPGDVAVARWVQGAPEPVAEPLARFATWIGSVPGLAAVAVPLALLLVLTRRLTEAALLLGVVLLRAANPALKDLFDSPRPSADLVLVTERARGLGFPSGHVMGVVLLWGTILGLSWRLVGRLGLRYLLAGTAMFVILVTGFGRVYTGAHWPSDVLGGYLWGIALLLLLLGGYRILRPLSGRVAARVQPWRRT